MKISTVEQMRAMDQAAIRTYGIDEALLMENAGGAAARVWLHEMDGSSRNVLILCGGGNNGGDGLVVAGICTPQAQACGCSVRQSGTIRRGGETQLVDCAESRD